VSLPLWKLLVARRHHTAAHAELRVPGRSTQGMHRHLYWMHLGCWRRPKTVLWAWLLWSQLVGFTRLDGQPEQVWLRLQLFQSAAECRETLSRFMTYDFYEASRVEQQRGSTVTAYPDGYRISNPVLGAHEMHYQCLPDTVDPRGAKGR